MASHGIKIGFLVLITTMLCSCKILIEDETPNPFQPSEEPIAQVEQPDSSTFVGIHKFILAPNCAISGCHDGSFEPDLRSPQSSFSSLVYHPPIKNDQMASYPFRVMPGDPNRSWLMERLLTEDQVLGRMPLFQEKLDDRSLKIIRDWIEEGAADMNNEIPSYPNLNPRIISQVAFNQDAVQVDSLKTGMWDSPFLLRTNWNIELRIEVFDDSTASKDLGINLIKFSYDPDDFSDAIPYPATYYRQNWWRIFFRTRDFEINRQIFYRYYVKDDDHPEGIEYPNNKIRDQYKQLYSFIIQEE